MTILEQCQLPEEQRTALLPLTVIVPVRNEARNLARCLKSLDGVGEVYVIDSYSTDGTADLACSLGAKVVQFHYRGGWPKKRQWAMDTLSFAYDWILLLDADEALSPELKEEIKLASLQPGIDGYYIAIQMHFLGRPLRHAGVRFYKLSLFRRGKARFECRLENQDSSMCDMEVHEHMIVDGATAKLSHPILHHNLESLSRYIDKHNQYSNWESRVLLNPEPNSTSLPASPLGSQAQRRRWLKSKFFALPGSPCLLFLYRYLVRLGFLDGVPGLVYCCFQAIQLFHTKAKIYELRLNQN